MGVDGQGVGAIHRLEGRVDLPWIGPLFRQGQPCIQKDILCHVVEALVPEGPLVVGLAQTSNHAGPREGGLIVLGLGLSVQNIVIFLQPFDSPVIHLISMLDRHGGPDINIGVDATGVVRVIPQLIIVDGETEGLLR